MAPNLNSAGLATLNEPITVLDSLRIARWALFGLETINVGNSSYYLGQAKFITSFGGSSEDEAQQIKELNKEKRKVQKKKRKEAERLGEC